MASDALKRTKTARNQANIFEKDSLCRHNWIRIEFTPFRRTLELTRTRVGLGLPIRFRGDTPRLGGSGLGDIRILGIGLEIGEENLGELAIFFSVLQTVPGCGRVYITVHCVMYWKVVVRSVDCKR